MGKRVQAFSGQFHDSREDRGDRDDREGRDSRDIRDIRDRDVKFVLNVMLMIFVRFVKFDLALAFADIALAEFAVCVLILGLIGPSIGRISPFREVL